MFFSLSAYMSEEKFFALASGEVRILSLDNGEEVLKSSDDVVSYLNCTILFDDSVTWLNYFLVKKML